MKLELTYGSDPELFIVDHTLRPCSAIRVLKNNKDKPTDLGDGIRFYADNALAELAFNPVSPDKIVDSIGNALLRAKQALGGDFGLMAQAVAKFSVRELRHKMAWEIGCNKNFDAYLFQPNPTARFTDSSRTGSFHIHIGNADWKSGKDKRLLADESKVQAIKLLDMFVGLTSLIWDKDPTAHSRRKLYGKAGEFRPTPYGVEYRVLGNYALRSKVLTKLVYDLVGLAMTHIENDTAWDVLPLIPEHEVIRMINEHDVAAAAHHIANLPIPIELYETIHQQSKIESPLAWSN